MNRSMLFLGSRGGVCQQTDPGEFVDDRNIATRCKGEGKDNGHDICYGTATTGSPL
jgi:hypothetical protein